MTAVLAALVVSTSAQTKIERPKNSYSPQDDVKLGREAAAEVRSQMPILDDERTEEFVERIGERLVEVVPQEFRQPEFRYTFDVVNLRDINAFALPGGPMFLNRGMIAAARTEGEVAGVMAHELSHVILRHGTAQARPGQKAQIGAIAGQILGSIIGGQKGAILGGLSELGAGAYFMKYGREYERQSDLLGAQMMARAGYDPREMAGMFETIERQGGNRGPEWLSSHPNPGNRVQAINREAEMLRVERRATAGDLRAVHARLNQLPPAQTMEQVARSNGGQRRAPTGTSGRSVRVEPPSSQWRTHQPADVIRLSVPANWEPIGGDNSVTYAPEGGYVRGDNGRGAFTHGIEVGIARVDGNSLQQQTEPLLRGFAQANPDLRRQGGYSRTTIAGRAGLTTNLSNVSGLDGEAESVNLSTVQLGDGNLLYLIGVAPASEARTYQSTFGRVRQTVQIAEAR